MRTGADASPPAVVTGVTVHGAAVNFAENQGVRHIFGGLVFSESYVFQPKNEPDSIP